MNNAPFLLSSEALERFRAFASRVNADEIPALIWGEQGPSENERVSGLILASYRIEDRRAEWTYEIEGEKVSVSPATIERIRDREVVVREVRFESVLAPYYILTVS